MFLKNGRDSIQVPIVQIVITRIVTEFVHIPDVIDAGVEAVTARGLRLRSLGARRTEL